MSDRWWKYGHWKQDNPNPPLSVRDKCPRCGGTTVKLSDQILCLGVNCDWKQDIEGIPVATYIFTPTCKHWREPVKVGEFTIWCSSYYGYDETLEPKPDIGVYLSTLWDSLLGKIWSNRFALKKAHVPYPAVIVDWIDRSGLGNGTLTYLVGFVSKHLYAGKQIDIGCHGGHGRTGTLLACLLVKFENLTPEQAIKEVRTRYCKEAIESKSQEKTIQEYYERRKK